MNAIADRLGDRDTADRLIKSQNIFTTVKFHALQLAGNLRGKV